MKKIVLYMHAGSGNHGCEAIVNSLCHMLESQVAVISNQAEEDRAYSLGTLCELIQERKFSEHRVAHLLYYLYRKLTGDRESFLRYRYRPLFGKEMSPLAVSIGGDNYCYDIMVKDLMLANRAFGQKGVKTVLLGCSIEPDLLQNPDVAADMNRYRAIYARESITYEALKGILKKETELHLYPDPAFTLGKKELPLPDGFLEGNTIGINISPMIQDKEKKAGIIMAGYRALIGYLVDHTDMQIALIPHVVWERNDDRKPLQALYDAFAPTGRVVLIPDGSCEELKGFIARCRMFIGARTHATIAAYSSLVPTLTVGYSVKARGIARDLFGRWENFVIPVQTVEKENELIDAFRWLWQEEEAIRVQLGACMPEYCNRALQAGKEVEKLWAELN